MIDRIIRDKYLIIYTILAVLTILSVLFMARICLETRAICEKCDPVEDQELPDVIILTPLRLLGERPNRPELDQLGSIPI